MDVHTIRSVRTGWDVHKIDDRRRCVPKWKDRERVNPHPENPMGETSLVGIVHRIRQVDPEWRVGSQPMAGRIVHSLKLHISAVKNA